ncbi:cardiolipin synthase [Terrimonas rubra]|uniref:Cardiolipin synthase n=1 Tax=Terrimonas rubra TaxID=1035890 RepID=A0ABW6A2I1_9BACT
MEAVWAFIKTYYFIPLALVYIGVIATILLENRNPAKSLAYILILLFLPGIGLVVYFFFGRDMRKKKIFSRKAFKDLELSGAYFNNYFEASGTQLLKMEQQIGDLVQPFRLLYQQRQSFVHTGNKVTLLTNGEEKFPALFEALEKAKHHIHIEYYIFSRDDVGERITEILLRKAAAGVKVRLIIDDSGSNRIKDIPKRLRMGGVEVYRFMPVHFASLSQANYRDHRKIVVIDGLVGFVGGINMDDRYLNNQKHSLYWRDTHVMIEGSAVKALQFQFFLCLGFVSKQQYELEPVYFPDREDEPGEGNISIAASGPDSAYPYNMEVLLSAIHQAKKSIRIVNPYFIPSDQVLTALQMAVAAGVEVELIIPGKSDSFIVQHSSFSYISPLIARGVKVYLYEKGFVHAKTMVVDGEIAFIGTVNMDIRSFYINFEIAAIIQDKALCRQMMQHFADDISHSRLIDAEAWANRPRLHKFTDSVCRLLTPLL